jgi:hypothetical protein
MRNILGLTASGIMSLMQENHQKNSQFLTAGQVFGLGNGHLGKEVRDEVIRRNEARKEKEAGVVLRKKSKLSDLMSRAKLIKDKMKDKNYKLTADNLRLLVAYKKRKGDAAIPSGKAALLARWNEIKHRPSPQCSPNNFEVEEEEKVEE